MPSKKRGRERSNFQQRPTKKHQTAHPQDSQKGEDLWKVLSKISGAKQYGKVAVDEPIEDSQLFVKITNEQHSKLCDFITDLTKSLDAECLILHESFIELKSFSLLQGCVALTAVFNYLHKLYISPNELDYCKVNIATLLRGSVLVHRSVKVHQTESVDELLFRKNQPIKAFRCQLASVSHIREFKEVYFEGRTLTDWMIGILNTFSKWRFRPVKENVRELLVKSSLIQKQSLISSISEIPFISQLFDVSLLNSKNKNLIESDYRHLETHMKHLETYNNEELSLVSKIDNKSKASRFSNSKVTNDQQRSSTKTTYSRFNGVAPNSRSAQETVASNPHTRSTSQYNTSNEEILNYCIETIKASIAKVSERSSFQIIKSYVKCPRNAVDMIYDHLNEIKAKTNCNVVVLNLQTIHESNAWFQQLHLNITSTPPPTSTRVVSVGGVGGNCKLALEMILGLMESGEI